MTDVEKLREIIQEIDELINKSVTKSDSDFQQWHIKAVRFLYNKYGSESIEYKEFTKLRFTLSMCTDTTPVSSFVGKCRRDLVTAKGVFIEYLKEMQESSSNQKVIEKTDCLQRIFTRFRKVAVQLARRYDDRDTLKIQDEYDVQDLLHSLLCLYFDDVRPEEWTPSYAGSAVRIDFLIPELEAVIEVKKTRPSMTDKKLSEELIIDIEKYQKHPNCKKIYCFVYDPDMILRNPVAIKNDLEQNHEGLVRVFIEA